jgi:hypothetical protein
MSPHYRTITFISICILLIGCAANRPSESAASTVEEYYQNNQTPPVGYSRVYVLPAFLSALLGDFDVPCEISIGKSDADVRPIAKIEKTQFVAFDIPEGSYFIKIVPSHGNYTTPTQTFNFVSSKTTVLKPLIHENNGALMLGSVGAAAGVLVGAGIDEAAHAGLPQFEFVGITQGLEKIRSMKMAGIFPEARNIIKQEIPPKRASITSQHAASLDKPSASLNNLVTDVEKNLQGLKRMYDRGLITKDEYDAKQKELLNQIH